MAGRIPPLRAPRLVVTRPADAQAAAREIIAARGGEAIPLPLVAIGSPADEAPLRRALAEWSSFAWVVFTSARSVAALVRAAGGRWPGAAAGPRVAAVGTATAKPLLAIGRPPDLVPRVQRGAELARELLATGLDPGSRLLWPRADQAMRDLADGLEQAGMELTEVVAYRTLVHRASAAELRGLGRVDAFLLASPSAARGLLGRVGAEGLRELHPRALVAAIGRTTADALQSLARPPDLMPERSTFTDLVDAVFVHLN